MCLPKRFVNFTLNINSVTGYRKITSLLQKEQSINHKRVQRIMQLEGLQHQDEETKTNRQPTHVAEHQLKRQFQANAPMQKLVTDVTCLPFDGKLLYLSSVLDFL